MISFKWSILDIFGTSELVDEVKFSLKASDEENSVETEGYHKFFDGVIYK